MASPQLRIQGTNAGNLCQKPRCWYYRGAFNCLRKGGPTCYAAEGENQFHCTFGRGDICYIVHPSDTAPALTALFSAAAKAVTSDAQALQKNMYKIPLFSGVIEDELTKLRGIIGNE